MTTTFAELTTLRVGGPIGRLETARTSAELVDLVQSTDAAGEQLLIVGGGSNLLVGDVGWPGTVVRVASTNVAIDADRVTADAGVDWDGLVQLTLAEGLSGLEAMSGVPGLVGGTPVQNVGAYGTATSDVLESVTVYDRETQTVAEWGPEECGFGSHRDSVFKRRDRWVIVAVTYRLTRGTTSRPVGYSELARTLGVEVGQTADSRQVREAVLGLRRGKAMLLDAEDHDTWSVGSFFLHPILSEVPAAARECPQYSDIKGTKLSAGWLIQHAGFPPGYGSEWGNGRVALSSRHALAITNRGGATAEDIVKFATHLMEGVEARFDVRLRPECDLINCSL